MKTLHAAIALAGLALAAQAGATVVGFDDLPTTSTTTTVINGLPTETPVDTVVPDGYAGFNYLNLNYVTGSNPLVLASTGGFAAGTASSPNVAYDSFGLGAMLISTTGAFNFNSAYLGRVYSAGVETFQGLRNGEVVYSADIALGTTAQLVSFNWTNIDSISFSAPEAYTALDPTRFTTTLDSFTLSPVPEPDALTLMGLSLGALALLRRRQLKRQRG
ncbi:PEP-CTERM sorting domain-containing protein [Derxia lacustris]|uniref:PEP-CTERM sorting domain-containing protein n=1 Tax=Derxia lacustris TaxID=764842 RepID=UPI000A17696D|nr:PEP-CTERM sorting domain-containing protein [Derxia lacustris]